MYLYKLLLKTVFITFIIALISCTTENMTDNNDDSNLYHNIDLDIVNLNDWTMSNEILSLINSHRSKNGLSPLIRDTSYASAYAIKHSLFMIENNEASHNLFFLRSNELKSKGAVSVSENVAYGYTSAESVVKAWLKSESHKKIIEGDFTNIGFGVLQSPENNKYFYTTLFYK